MKRQAFSKFSVSKNEKSDEGNTATVSEAKLNQARKSGVLNLSNNQWKVIPENVWNLNQVPRTTEVASFDGVNSDWWSNVELTKLNISSNLLTTLSEDIQNFEFLKVFDAHDNKLIALPNSFENFSALEHVNLSHNELSTLQTPLNGLVNVRVLLLQHNQLTGLPSSIGCLEKCEKLDVSHNKLTSLPPEIEQIEFLKDLNFSFNLLPSFPQGFGRLKSLRVLDASNNKLTSIPESFGNLPNLEILSLRNNMLTTLPSLHSCAHLKELTMGNNQLKVFPCDLPCSVAILELRENKISVLPASVTQLNQLERLDIANNNISNLPPEIGSMESIKVVVVSGNPIRTISSHILNKGTQALLKYLRSRIVATDEPNVLQTSGVIPQSGSNHDLSNKHLVSASKKLDLAKENPVSVQTKLSSYSELVVTEIILCRCTLTSLPEGVLLYKSGLTALNVSSNKITSLPAFIGLCTQLHHLDISANVISSLPGDLQFCTNLREINMSYNKFQCLPDALFQLKNLEVLIADSNQVKRIDVPNLKQLPSLTTLSLQNNCLGEVPPELGLLTKITTLKLDGNLFRVPRQNVLQKGTVAIMEYLRSRLPV